MRLMHERGYAMVALLVLMAVMAVMLGVALPAWRTYAQREKEAEFVFRGEQYARAIRMFQQKFAGASPPNLDVLVEERFLRKKYKDPLTGDDFQIVTNTTPGNVNPGQPPTPAGRAGGVGIVGVTSKSTEKMFRIYRGRDIPNQVAFVPVAQGPVGGPGGRAGQTGRGADGRGGRDGRGGPIQPPSSGPGRGPTQAPGRGPTQPPSRGGFDSRNLPN